MNQDKTKFKIAEFVNQEIPAEILEQLKIADRIQHVLKPTTTSAVSTSEQKSDSTPDSLITIDDVNADIDGLIDEVKEFENLVEQLEDMVDEHLKNMEIPPINETVAAAIKKLDPNGPGNITKDVLDKAIAILDYLPMMSLGTDPILAALVGDGTIEGPWVECNEFTSALANEIKAPPREEYQADTSIRDQSLNIADKHEKRMLEMMLETLLMLWWNMLWPKTVVDATIINPTRLAIANPFDTFVLFFKKIENVERFRKKNKELVTKYGPINILLNRLRILLLCKVPPSVYKRYKPMVEIDCSSVSGDCPPPKEEKQFKEDNKNAMSQMGEMMDEISDGGCFTDEELLGNVNSDQPKGFGSSPECAKAAKVILDAVISDALTPPDNSIKDPAGASSTKSTILGTGAI